MKEEQEKLKLRDIGEIAREKAKIVIRMEEEKKYMVNVVVFSLDNIIEELKKCEKVLKISVLSKKDASLVRGKLLKISKDSQELLMDIKTE